jgi:hypothetical protein
VRIVAAALWRSGSWAGAGGRRVRGRSAQEVGFESLPLSLEKAAGNSGFFRLRGADDNRNRFARGGEWIPVVARGALFDRGGMGKNSLV